MKNLFLASLLLFVFSGFSTTGAQDIYAKWPLLKDVHHVMSETFHPAEEGDFKPIRTRSGELVAITDSLLKSPIPEEFRKPGMKKAVAKLAKGAKELDKVIKKNISDKKLMKAFTRLHDVFHEISGLCKDTEEDHKDTKK